MAVLSESDSMVIVQYEGCGHIGLIYNNIMMNFNEQQFNSFSQVFEAIDFDRCAAHFPDEEKRLVMNTKLPDVQFCFKKDEFEQVRESIKEATIILEARSLINS